MTKKYKFLFVKFITALFILNGCSNSTKFASESKDPFEKINRNVFQFNKYIDQIDADPLIAVFIPDAGNELNPIWDIKVGAGWSNFIEMGKARNSGYKTGNSNLQDTWGSVVDCDTPRVYTSNQVRAGVNQ